MCADLSRKHSSTEDIRSGPEKLAHAQPAPVSLPTGEGCAEYPAPDPAECQTIECPILMDLDADINHSARSSDPPRVSPIPDFSISSAETTAAQEDQFESSSLDKDAISTSSSRVLTPKVGSSSLPHKSPLFSSIDATQNETGQPYNETRIRGVQATTSLLTESSTSSIYLPHDTVDRSIITLSVDTEDLLTRRDWNHVDDIDTFHLDGDRFQSPATGHKRRTPNSDDESEHEGMRIPPKSHKRKLADSDGESEHEGSECPPENQKRKIADSDGESEHSDGESEQEAIEEETVQDSCTICPFYSTLSFFTELFFFRLG